jgi:hypothetical protein
VRIASGLIWAADSIRVSRIAGQEANQLTMDWPDRIHTIGNFVSSSWLILKIMHPPDVG